MMPICLLMLNRKPSMWLDRSIGRDTLYINRGYRQSWTVEIEDGVILSASTNVRDYLSSFSLEDMTALKEIYQRILDAEQAAEESVPAMKQVCAT